MATWGLIKATGSKPITFPWVDHSLIEALYQEAIPAPFQRPGFDAADIVYIPLSSKDTGLIIPMPYAGNYYFTESFTYLFGGDGARIEPRS